MYIHNTEIIKLRTFINCTETEIDVKVCTNKV